MSINCKQIIEAAYSRSTFNDPGKIATDKELIGVIDRYMRALYAQVARVNPDYFGDSAAVAGSSGTWARPAAAEVITRVETAGNSEVNITPFKDRQAEVAPRIYRYGPSYRTVGLTGDPGASDTLTFFFSKKHPNLDPTLAADNVANQLDATFPSQFFDLPVIRVGRYLAVKDGRGGEVQMMDSEEASLMQILQLHLENQDAGMVSRFRQKPRLVAPTPEPFGRQG
jgi:hypothetical protein